MSIRQIYRMNNPCMLPISGRSLRYDRGQCTLPEVYKHRTNV